MCRMLEEQKIGDAFFTVERFEAILQGLGRSRIAFHCYVGAFVIISAFLFGLSNGLSKQLPRAYASISPAETFSKMGQRWGKPPPVPLAVSGITPIPIGDDITINGKPAAVMMFSTDLGVKDVVNSQISLWRDQGLKAAGISSSDRGSALAFSRETGDRYTITAWRTKGGVTPRGEPEPPVQGIISFLKSGVSIGSSQEEIGGEVPGVAPMPGATTGSVFSSFDRGGRSFTAPYTNPARMADTMSFYKLSLTADGWQAILEDEGESVGSLRMVKDREQVIILFNRLRSSKDEGDKTLATITRSPREEDMQ